MYSYGPPHMTEQKAGRPARTYTQQLCEDTGCSPEDLPEAMSDREIWRERVRDIRAGGMTWWYGDDYVDAKSKVLCDCQAKKLVSLNALESSVYFILIFTHTLIYVYIYIYIYIYINVLPAIVGRTALFSLGRTTSLGEEKLRIQTSYTLEVWPSVIS